jgi:DNA polymerase bacteriophage-type
MKVARATIDFETRSSIDLKKVGAFRYGQHWDTRALCLAYKIPGQEVKLWHPDLPPPIDLFFWVEDGGMVEAHNAEFEWVIWNYVQTRHGWPALSWKQLLCSAAKGAVMGLPRSLEGLCDVLNTEVRKDKDGKKIMLRLAKLKRPTTKEPDSWDEDPEKRAKLYSYCIDDVLSEEAASHELPDLTPLEQKMWRHTEMINERGIYCDIETCARAAEVARRFERELLGELKIVTGGQVKTAKQHARLLTFIRGEGVETENLQAATVQHLLKQDGLTHKAKRALQIRATLNKSSLSKFDTMIRMAGPDKRIRGTLMHHGASTGRDTGRGIQPQNYIYDKTGQANPEKIIHALNGLDYDDFKLAYPKVFESLSFILRGMLRAAPGKKFVAADFAAIETRVLFWLANHDVGLEIFYRGEDIYIEMARAIYGLSEEAWGALNKEERKAKRQLGKQAILGLGYGMGAKKFVMTCANYGIVITEEFAKKVVKLYRTLHWPIKALWNDIETAAIGAVTRPGKTYTAGKSKFFKQGRFLVVELPSKRRIYYCDPEISTRETEWGNQDRLGYYAPNSTTKRWQYEETYGGKFCENLVQAVAADLMREGALRQEIRGFPIVIRVHDELIAEVDQDRECLGEFETLMSELPAWAKGCPVTVEGWEGPRYKK